MGSFTRLTNSRAKACITSDRCFFVGDPEMPWLRLLALDLPLYRKFHRSGERCTFERCEFSHHRMRFLVFYVQTHAIHLSTIIVYHSTIVEAFQSTPSRDALI